jgi:hypothetical protein
MAHARQQHAGVVGFELAELVGTLADLLREAIEHRLALAGAQRGPRRKSPLRGDDGGIDMRGRAFADAAEHALVDRRLQLEGLGRRNAPPFDVVIGRD